jgi:hypothetical protein
MGLPDKGNYTGKGTEVIGCVQKESLKNLNLAGSKK